MELEMTPAYQAGLEKVLGAFLSEAHIQEKISGWVPAKIKGVIRLQGTHQAAINFVTLTVRCDVPLLGRKIARFLAMDSQAKIENEYRITRELL